MRNDAHDELEVIPSLLTDSSDRLSRKNSGNPPSEAVVAVSSALPTGNRAGNGPLWALVVALLIAIGVLAWWSLQQITLLNQQLVATQESFAQISEEAAGRIRDISGKVVATESSVTSESESLKLRVKQLEGKLAELGKQQQNLLAQGSTQGKRVESLSTELKGQQSDLKQSDGKLQALAAAQEKLQSAQATFAALDARVKTQGSEIDLLKQQGKSIGRIEQDLLVLRSQLDSQLTKNNSTAEFDAFRAQITRNLNTLQTQIQTLQQQSTARP